MAERYHDSHPFLGVVLAGEFTEPSIEQFKSHGFNVIHCSYETVLQAFASEGVDVSSEEDSSDGELQRKVDAYGSLGIIQRDRIAAQIRDRHRKQFGNFFDRLRGSLTRRVDYVFVLPLFGTPRRFESIYDAVDYITSHDPSLPAAEFVKYELDVRYSNGDEIRGIFHDKRKAIEFLRLNSGSQV